MAQQDQNPPPESMVLQQFEGLQNTVGPERLKPTKAVRAKNVDLDDAGQYRRRRGYRRTAIGDFHSLSRDTDALYGVKDNDLVRIYPNYTFKLIQSGVGPARISYVQIGEDVFFSSSATAGVIAPDGAVSAWAVDQADPIWYSPIAVPTSTLQPIKGKLLKPPPLSTAMAYFNGRIYLAKDRVLWATELFNYMLVDVNANWRYFESTITAIGAVTDGIYVGTENGVWFMSGQSYGQMARIPISQYGVIPGTMLSVPAELVDPKTPTEDVAESKNAVVFMTTSGLMAGFDNGRTYNLTQNEVLFPEAVDGAAMFRRQDGVNQVVTVLNSEGTPGGGMRIGDYVDAALVRAGNNPTVVEGFGFSDFAEAVKI